MARRVAVMAVMAAALAMPAVAWSGGWATVGLSSLPDGTRPGQPWVVDLEVLQHGRTPLDGVVPRVTVRRRGTGAVRSYEARPTGRSGFYRARVVFPTAGRWTYVIDDGFSQRHAYGPVRIAESTVATMAAPARRRTVSPTPPPPGGSGFPWATLAASLAAGLAAAGFTALAQRHRGTAGAAPAGH